MSNLVYLSIGSNLGDSASLVTQALQSIASIPYVDSFKASELYQTSPVSSIPQNDFINAACQLRTTLTAEQLYRSLHAIEVALGKKPKPKNHPRIIDIDILIFGTHFYNTQELCIPHPHWKERLFVLLPLLELTEEIAFPIDVQGTMETLNIKEIVLQFPP